MSAARFASDVYAQINSESKEEKNNNEKKLEISFADLFSGPTVDKIPTQLHQSFSRITTLSTGEFLLALKNEKYVTVYNPITQTSQKISVLNEAKHFFVNGKDVFYTFNHENIFHPKLNSEYSALFAQHFIGFTKLSWPLESNYPVLTFLANNNKVLFDQSVLTHDGHLFCFGNAQTFSISINLKTFSIDDRYKSYYEYNQDKLTSVQSLSNGLLVTTSWHTKNALDLQSEMINSWSKDDSNTSNLLKFLQVMSMQGWESPFVSTIKLGGFKNNNVPESKGTPNKIFNIFDKIITKDTGQLIRELPAKKQLIVLSQPIDGITAKYYSLAGMKLTLLSQYNFDKKIRILDFQPIQNGDILVGYGYENTDVLFDQHYFFSWSPNMVFPHFEKTPIGGEVLGLAISDKLKQVGLITNEGFKSIPYSAFIEHHISPAKDMRASTSRLFSSAPKQARRPLPNIEDSLLPRPK